jgi:predicted dehydrogenase
MTRRTWMTGAMLAAAAPQPLRLPHKVRLAILGLEGHTSEILDPLPLLPDVELVAIADRDPRALAGFARHPAAAHARQYGDYRPLLDRERPDMAGIGGPNGERAQIILACAGRKIHIVAEKPLAIDRDGLERVKRAVADNGVRLTMLLPMRFEPPYAAMRRIVESGALGEVAQMAAQKSYKLGERPDWMRHRASFGGTIPYIGIHLVDLMRFTSGRELVETVSFQARIGFAEMGGLENTTATLFRLDNGGTATMHLDYLRPETAPTHGDDRLRLAGTRGVLEFQEAAGLTLVTAKGPPRPVRDLPAARSLFLDFLDSVYNGKPAGLSLEDIYRANEIVLAARESADRAGVKFACSAVR